MIVLHYLGLFFIVLSLIEGLRPNKSYFRYHVTGFLGALLLMIQYMISGDGCFFSLWLVLCVLDGYAITYALGRVYDEGVRDMEEMEEAEKHDEGDGE